MINAPFLIGPIISRNVAFLFLLILAIVGAVALTFYFSQDTRNARKYERKIEEEKQYIFCPKCKHLVDTELEFCQNCGNQM